MQVASTAEQIAEVVYEVTTYVKDYVRYVADAKAMYLRRLEIGNEEFRKKVRRTIVRLLSALVLLIS